ncbi:hypothetical protein VHEMI01181 [[Torrubiella] hemipterigena]|uniref:AMP-dependent synthetase/ligase domain-containing protein n=1 Tax=[Torrubiella] hemipterigena TaxID=1531966 RepID=A0A0A1T6Q8_9HYPO|nr:hypothetical protein VHEMI01181 [[Torrubiella] hemipterigena]
MSNTPSYQQLPNEPIFVQLLGIAQKVQHTIVYDANKNVDTGYAQLLADLLQTRRRLQESLADTLLDSTLMIKDTAPYMFLLPDGTYDFLVGAYSILSVGGAFIPLSSSTLPDEALWLFRKCQSFTIVASRINLPKLDSLRQHALSNGHDLTIIIIQDFTPPLPEISAPSIAISPTLQVPAQSPGMLLFTSGTSGPPKGVVHKRTFFYQIHARSEPSDVILHSQHYMWIGGIRSLFRSSLSGARLEVTRNDPEVLWERVRQGDVTHVGGNPPLWQKMMVYYKQNLENLSSNEIKPYLTGVRKLRLAHVAGAMAHRSLLQFWRDLGRPLTVFYGITETAGRLTFGLADDRMLEGSIGRPLPNVILRLSKGDHGEIEAKLDDMFAGYIGDEAATAAAMTDDGFYRTGDAARCIDGEYVLEGRESSDCKTTSFSLVHSPNANLAP